MARYIDADKKTHIQVYDDEHEEFDVLEKTIAECLDSYTEEGCPEAADVQKVTHAHWIIIEYEYFTCSACGESYFNGMDSNKMAEDYLKNNGAYKYCPWCGAKMDGKE